MTHEEMVENCTMMENTMPKISVESVKEYRPSDNEALRKHGIQIEFLHRGCIVRVGCKDIAFQNVQDAINAINDYVKNPYEEQVRWGKLLD
jgi:hypothetical protein